MQVINIVELDPPLNRWDTMILRSETSECSCIVGGGDVLFCRCRSVWCRRPHSWHDLLLGQDREWCPSSRQLWQAQSFKTVAYRLSMECQYWTLIKQVKSFTTECAVSADFSEGWSFLLTIGEKGLNLTSGVRVSSCLSMNWKTSSIGGTDFWWTV